MKHAATNYGMTAMALAAAMTFAAASSAYATQGVSAGSKAGSLSSKPAPTAPEDGFDSGGDPGHQPQKSSSIAIGAFERASDVIQSESEAMLRSLATAVTIVTPEVLLYNAIAADAAEIAAQISHNVDGRMYAASDRRFGQIDRKAAVNKLSRIVHDEASRALQHWARGYMARVGAVNAALGNQLDSQARRLIPAIAASLTAAVKAGLEEEFSAPPSPEDELG